MLSLIARQKNVSERAERLFVEYMENPEKNENNKIENQQIQHIGREMADILDDLNDRIGDTAENIADRADDLEQLRSDIKPLLDDLKILQSRIAPQKRDKLDPLIDRLEGVYGELGTAVWAMDCARETLTEDADLSEILERPVDSCG